MHRLLIVMVQCCENRADKWAKTVASGELLNITEETSRLRAGTDHVQHLWGRCETSIEDGENPFAFLSRDSTRDLSVVMQVRAA